MGVFTLLVGGVAQDFHDSDYRAQGTARSAGGRRKRQGEQVEVEREKRLKEVRPWMTMEMCVTRLKS